MAKKIRNKDGVPIKTKTGEDVLGTFLDEIEIKEHDENNKSFLIVASSENVDRDGDIIMQDGWNLKNFKRNPVMLWSHGYDRPPLAVSDKTWVDKKENQLMVRPKFDVNDEFALKIYNKYINGFMKAVSVGFAPEEYEKVDEDANDWWGPFKFIKQELLEVSFVNVPAHQDALIVENGAEEDKVKNLTAHGFTEVFSQTKSGLFYPVRDIVTYYDPEEVDLSEIKQYSGIKGIYAKSISADEDTAKDLVGFACDPEVWDDYDFLNDVISEVVPDVFTTKYYIVDFEEGTLKEHEEEMDRLKFDTPLDMDADIDDEVEDKNPDSEGFTVVQDEDSEVKTAFEYIKNINDCILDVKNCLTSELKDLGEKIGYIHETLDKVNKTLEKIDQTWNNKDSDDPDNGGSNKGKADEDLIELDESLFDDNRNSEDQDSTSDKDFVELDTNLEGLSSLVRESIKDSGGTIKNAFKTAFKKAKSID